MIRLPWTPQQTAMERQTSDDVSQAAQRMLGLTPHAVQIQGGLEVSRGRIAEMETGEGKTLAAVLPATLHARAGRPVLIATANDYLATRDAEAMSPLYAALGLRVAAITAGLSRSERWQRYQHDIVYGTAREFGFDYLRDHLEQRRREQGEAALLGGAPQRVHRAPGFLLLDEADSLMIDEARTPLLISGPTGPVDFVHEASYRWATLAADKFIEGTDFLRLGASGWPAITSEGRRKFRQIELPPALDSLGLTELHHALERALFVQLRYRRDQHYVVRDQQVQIVDEFTGRIQSGRQWNDGIHQAIEAREGVPLTAESGCLAQVTLQTFIRRYPSIGGMTGTAREAAQEFRAVYGMELSRIPTHRPLRRVDLGAIVCRSMDEKWDSITRESLAMQQAGRAVLIGTPSIELSMGLAERLREAGLSPVVLNALNPEKEADVIAQAGQPGAITVATNMAGRGTDIKLADSVRDRGGLHVICSESHASGRIDRQLTGRCGRQGDPGSYRHYHSLDDQLLLLTNGPDWVERRRRRWSGTSPTVGVSHFERAQRQIERDDLQARLDLDERDHQRHIASLALGLDPVLDAIT
ncbi:MAG: DEAD/DEAH box helicase [Planctomycetaceae bacterium]